MRGMRFLVLPLVRMAEALAEGLGLDGEGVGMGIQQLILLILLMLHPMLHRPMVTIIRLCRGRQQGQT